MELVSYFYRVNKHFQILLVGLLITSQLTNTLQAQNAWSMSPEFGKDEMQLEDTIYAKQIFAIDSTSNLSNYLLQLNDAFIFDSINHSSIYLIRYGIEVVNYKLIIRKKKIFVAIPLSSFYGSSPPQIKKIKLFGNKKFVISVSGFLHDEKNSNVENENNLRFTKTLIQWIDMNSLECIFSQITDIHYENEDKIFYKNILGVSTLAKHNFETFDQSIIVKIEKKKLNLEISWHKETNDLIADNTTEKSQQLKLKYKREKNYWLRERTVSISF